MKSRPTLNLPEWCLVTFFLTLMGTLVVISKISSAKARHVLSTIQQEKTVRVEVTGEIYRPGIYEVDENSSIGELVRKVKPKKFADLSNLSLDSPVGDRALISIPVMEEIRVYIEGEVVEPYEFMVTPGTRICELKSKIIFKEGADPSPFKSRRKVGCNEKITVVRKK